MDLANPNIWLIWHLGRNTNYDRHPVIFVEFLVGFPLDHFLCVLGKYIFEISLGKNKCSVFHLTCVLQASHVPHILQSLSNCCKTSDDCIIKVDIVVGADFVIMLK